MKKSTTIILSALLSSSCAMANYDDYCDDTLGDVVEGAVVGGAVGVGIGAVADGSEGAKRGAAIGATVGAVDGLVEGAVKAERCRRVLVDLEDEFIVDEIVDELDRQALEDAIIEDELEYY